MKIHTLPVVSTETFLGSLYPLPHILRHSLVEDVGKGLSPAPPGQIGSRREIGNPPGRQVCGPTIGPENLRENTDNPSLRH